VYKILLKQLSAVRKKLRKPQETLIVWYPLYIQAIDYNTWTVLYMHCHKS